jgi:endonuclease III
MTARKTLAMVHDKLRRLHGDVPGPGITDPFQLVLWEQVGYLADDERRGRAFALLAERVGLTPQAILAAGDDVLVEIAAMGGSIAAAQRASRMRQSALHVLTEWGGDLSNALRLPADRAIRALMKLPMIGKPGAERILLLTRNHPFLAPESNGLRVLLRLGYGSEDRRYDRSYESVRRATELSERTDYDWLIQLHRLLRRHGQTVCRRTAPRCAECPLTRECAYYARAGIR